MEFKSKTEREQYHYRQLHPKLMDLLTGLDGLAAVAGKKITITCLHRPNDLDSYHSKWQAVDLRTYDWTTGWREFVTLILLRLKAWDKCVQFEFEPSAAHPTSDEHLHIELDDNTLNKEKVV